MSTRTRELLLISSSTSILSLYPHLLNGFPLLPDRVAKKKDKIHLFFAKIFYACTRVFTIIILIYPPVIAFVSSIAIYGDHFFYFLPIIVIISVQAMAAVAVEVIPPIFGKIYYQQVFGAS